MPATARRVSGKLYARLSLVVAGAAAIVVSFGFHGQPEAQRATADIPVNPGARNPGDIDANNSPSLAQDPRQPAHLAVANRVDTPRYSCTLGISRDGGDTWSRVPVPIPAGEQPECYAPDVSYASDGTLYMAYLTLRGAGNVPDAVWLVHSTDGGRTLSAPHRLLGPLAFQVRLITDPAHPHRLYVTWLKASGTGLYRFSSPGNPIEVMRSNDGGARWGAPVRVSSPGRPLVVAPAPAIGPRGVLYIVYLDLGNDLLDYEGAHQGFGGPPYGGRFSLVLARSLDAGATWQESVVDSAIVPTQRFIVFLPPSPALAVDSRSGRIYAGYTDGRDGDADVYVWSLGPGARAWSRPVRVNDTPLHDHRTQDLPALAVAPDGRLDVLYYDRRGDPHNRLTGVSLQSSFDGGRTFSPHLAVTDRSFDSQIGAGSERGLPDLGSRLALVSANADALTAWTDTRAGTVLSGKQDIAFARVAFSSAGGLASATRDVLRYGGILLILLGLLLPRIRTDRL